MKYTAECPECLAELDVAGPNSAANGVHCTRCGHRFTPEKIHRVLPAEDEEKRKRDLTLQSQRSQEYLRLKDQATNFIAASMLMAVIAIIAFVAAAIQDEAANRLIALEISGGAFSLGLVCFIVAQLVFIRAALEKLSLKE